MLGWNFFLLDSARDTEKIRQYCHKAGIVFSLETAKR